MQIAVKGGFNVLLVDQLAHGKSEGKCLTFGVMERYDCLSWVSYAIERFGENAKILLNGMSMGAATVLMAGGLPLPDNVVGIVADCGYSSPSAIVKKVMRDYHLPPYPLYWLVRLGGKIFGGFDLEAASASEALEKCKIPVLLIHGDDDRFVPCGMGRENYEHCASENKKLLIVPGAGHGISYMVDINAYMTALTEFLSSVL
ncbi:MAG: alpha/beta hydrolase [Oscillospiraceae bacterium]|nr:alpha/beta hydrolase [Oscillospiraceae bacterium]